MHIVNNSVQKDRVRNPFVYLVLLFLRKTAHTMLNLQRFPILITYCVNQKGLRN